MEMLSLRCFHRQRTYSIWLPLIHSNGSQPQTGIQWSATAWATHVLHRLSLPQLLTVSECQSVRAYLQVQTTSGSRLLIAVNILRRIYSNVHPRSFLMKNHEMIPCAVTKMIQVSKCTLTRHRCITPRIQMHQRRFLTVTTVKQQFTPSSHS